MTFIFSQPSEEMPSWTGIETSHFQHEEALGEISIIVDLAGQSEDDRPPLTTSDYSPMTASSVPSPQSNFGDFFADELAALSFRSPSLGVDTEEQQSQPNSSTLYEEADSTGILLSCDQAYSSSPTGPDQTFEDWFQSFASDGFVNTDEEDNDDQVEHTTSPLPLLSPTPRRPFLDSFPLPEHSFGNQHHEYGPTRGHDPRRHATARFVEDGKFYQLHNSSTNLNLHKPPAYRSPTCSTEGEAFHAVDRGLFRKRIATSGVLKAAEKRRQRVPAFKCPICNYSLTSKDNLKNHINAHNGIRPFECDTCSKKFGTRSVLNRHRKSLKCLMMRKM